MESTAQTSDPPTSPPEETPDPLLDNWRERAKKKSIGLLQADHALGIEAMRRAHLVTEGLAKDSRKILMQGTPAAEPTGPWDGDEEMAVHVGDIIVNQPAENKPAPPLPAPQPAPTPAPAPAPQPATPDDASQSSALPAAALATLAALAGAAGVWGIDYLRRPAAASPPSQ